MYVILNNIGTFDNKLRHMEKIINYNYNLPNALKSMEIIESWDGSMIIWMSQNLAKVIQQMTECIKIPKDMLDAFNAVTAKNLPGMQIIVRKFDNDDYDYSDIINPNLFIRKDSDAISTYELIYPWQLHLQLLLQKLDINTCMSIKTMLVDMDIKDYSENNEWFKDAMKNEK